MTETTLRAVFTRDRNTRRYVPAGHNLTVLRAEQRAARLQEDGFEVAVAVQSLRHGGRGFKSCEACKNAAENLSGPLDASAESGGNEEVSTAKEE